MNRLKFYSVKTGRHEDARRTIVDYESPSEEQGMLGDLPIVQVKDMRFTEAQAKNGMVVGNHYHTQESNRHEFFVAMGNLSEAEAKERPLFLLRWKDEGAIDTQERPMHQGDACYIPPGVTHSFKALGVEATLCGLSNRYYDSHHDIPDKILE